jgi:hypothetical protein
MGLMDAPRGMRLHTAMSGPKARTGNDGRQTEAQPWA